MTVVPTIACVLTHNRPEMLKKLVFRLDTHMDSRFDGPIIILDNASDPPVERVLFERFMDEGDLEILSIDLQPPNLAYNMNVGFNRAAEWAQENGHPQWNVVMLCDDIDLPDGWVSIVTGNMREGNWAAASTHTIRPAMQPIIKTQPDSDIINRMQGSAFCIAGERRLRADENLHWWWQDTDLDFQARLSGGMLIVPGPVATNQRPNDFTYSVPGLGDRAGVDRVNFQKKWGYVPW